MSELTAEQVEQLIGLITWMHQVVHCSHVGGKDNCCYEICKCATLMRKELAAKRLTESK